MRNFRKHAAFFGVVFLSNAFFSSTMAQNGVDPRLIQKCNSGDGKSCAFVGALTFKHNEKLARTYYKKACDFGYTASCVFTGDTTVGDVKLPSRPQEVRGSVSGAVDEANTKVAAQLWYDKFLKHYMESSEEDSAKPREGQIRSKPWRCITDSKQEGSTLVSVWKFGDYCDLDGLSRIITRTNTMMSGNSSFRVRNAGDAAMFVFDSQMEMTAEGHITSHKMKSAVVNDAQGKEILKFEANYNYESGSKNPTGGQITILSFRGTPINLVLPIEYKGTGKENP